MMLTDDSRKVSELIQVLYRLKLISTREFQISIIKLITPKQYNWSASWTK